MDIVLSGILRATEERLFAPKQDLSESKDLAKSDPDRVKALQKRAKELLGDGWLAKEAGTVSFSGAYGLHRGRKANKSEKLERLFGCCPMMLRFSLALKAVLRQSRDLLRRSDLRP